jgi:hypothetical protein
MTDVLFPPTKGDVKPITHLYIDDLRDPVRYLGAERGGQMTWVKDWWEAKGVLRDHATTLEEIHFDHYLGDNHTGGQLFEMIMYRLDRFPALKRCYLHSSDQVIVNRLIDRHDIKAKAHSVELIANSNRY